MDRDDNFSSLKHEFSRIFHENNLQSFTNASDIGFLELGKLANQGFSGEYEDTRGLGDADNQYGRPYQKEDTNPYMGAGMHNAYSPLRFLPPHASNLGYANNYPNIGNVVQDSAFYQPYQPYKYTDYYVDHAAQPNALFPQNVYDMYSQPDALDTHPNNPLSMMWSNEAHKNLHKKSVDDIMQAPQAVPSKGLSSALTAQQGLIKQVSMKVEQDFEKVSNKTLGIQLDRASKVIPEGNGANLRRTNRISKPLYTAAMNEDEDESVSEDDKDDGYGDAKTRSSRGLRVLSLKVRDIVSKRKKTSYKEVAEALLEDLNQKLKGRPQSEIAKEEQNVKRRVYDALNVLIAADVLRKEGKLVCVGSASINLGSEGKKKLKNEKASLLEQIQEIKKRKKEKMEALQELVFKSLAVKNLIRMNKEKEGLELVGAKNTKANPFSNDRSQKANYNTNATRVEVVQQTPALKQKSQDVISFPFIVVMSSSPENSMNLNMDSSQKQLSIESKKPFDIFGDIDVLLKMKLHYVPKQVFDKEIPKELQKYVSQSFLDALK